MLAALAAVAAYTGRSAAEAADLAHRALRTSACCALARRRLRDRELGPLHGRPTCRGGSRRPIGGLAEAQRRGSAPMFLQLALRANRYRAPGRRSGRRRGVLRARPRARPGARSRAVRSDVPALSVLIERGRIDEAAAMVESMALPDAGANAATCWRFADSCGSPPGASDRVSSDLLDADDRIAVPVTPEHRDHLGPVGRRRADCARPPRGGDRDREPRACRGVCVRRAASSRDRPLGVRQPGHPGRRGSPGWRGGLDPRTLTGTLGLRAGVAEPRRGTARSGASANRRGGQLSQALDIAARCGATTLAERARRS